MLFRDLRELLATLEKMGDLRRVEGADWDLEMGAIVELTAERDGPALLFDKIKGYPAGYRVTGNLWSSLRRCALVTGMPPEVTGLEYIKKWREFRKGFQPVPPRLVKTGPVLENVKKGKDVNMLAFPVPRWHELDGGRYIGTGSTTILRDPDSGYVNLGCYRVMVHDETTLGFYVSPNSQGHRIRQKYWEKGQSCPVAICFGQDPAVWCAATYSLPFGVSEYDFSGYMRGEPVEVIKGELTGLPFSASAEIVIEGEAPPPSVEQRMEGPFGESPGYYAHGALLEPIIRVKAIYHREQPIIDGEPPLKPPLFFSFRHTYADAAEMWGVLEVAGFKEVRGVYPVDAGRHSMYVISMKQTRPGLAKQAALCLASQGYFAHFIILVDEDIDPSDMNDVLWAMATRCDPQYGIDIVRDVLGGKLDPSLPPWKKEEGDITSSTAIINACRPYHWKDRYPPVNRVSEGLRRKTLQAWPSLFKQG